MVRPKFSRRKINNNYIRIMDSIRYSVNYRRNYCFYERTMYVFIIDETKNMYFSHWIRGSSYVVLGLKIIKNRADILQKVASKNMLQLGTILDPTWLNFGRVLAPKLGPTWPQVALKSDPKTTKNQETSDQKTYH